MQNNLQNSEGVDLMVYHNLLGPFKLNVNHTGPNKDIFVEIATFTSEGKEFFKQHESNLVDTLTKSGLKIWDVKVVPSGEFAILNSESENSNYTRNDTLLNKNDHHSHERQDPNDDYKRRQELWRMFKEKDEA